MNLTVVFGIFLEHQLHISVQSLFSNTKDTINHTVVMLNCMNLILKISQFQFDT